MLGNVKKEIGRVGGVGSSRSDLKGLGRVTSCQTRGEKKITSKWEISGNERERNQINQYRLSVTNYCRVTMAECSRLEDIGRIHHFPIASRL